MQYLAQVVSKEPKGTAKFQLLAAQKAECAWVKLAEEAYIFSDEAIAFGEGMLVLLHITKAQKIEYIEDAKHWLLEILDQYLTIGISPNQLREEAERAEQWRQSLTLKSQELARRALEMEARQDQIQQVEESLKREKKQLELLAAELQGGEEDLKINLNSTGS